MVVGRIENLIPIGLPTVLGYEKCSAEAVDWALQQGSSFDDIERTLRTVAAMQELDCFPEQFGPEVATRIGRPLAAATEALAFSPSDGSECLSRAGGIDVCDGECSILRSG